MVYMFSQAGTKPKEKPMAWVFKCASGTTTVTDTSNFRKPCPKLDMLVLFLVDWYTIDLDEATLEPQMSRPNGLPKT